MSALGWLASACRAVLLAPAVAWKAWRARRRRRAAHGPRLSLTERSMRKALRVPPGYPENVAAGELTPALRILRDTTWPDASWRGVADDVRREMGRGQ